MDRRNWLLLLLVLCC